MNNTNNIIVVRASTFNVNRRNPREVSYDFVDQTKWRPVFLDTYVNIPPDPGPNQIKYVLEYDPYRAAYEPL
jgi:hypothetical protein